MTKWRCTYDQINIIFIYYTLSPGGSSISALIPDIKWWHQESWGICQSEIHGSEGQSGEQLHHERVWPFAICGETPYRMYCRHRWHYCRTYQIKWAKDTQLITVICSMLTLWIRFGIVADSFTQGLLIPLLKNETIDPTIPKHYRPIVVSTTLSKIL